MMSRTTCLPALLAVAFLLVAGCQGRKQLTPNVARGNPGEGMGRRAVRSQPRRGGNVFVSDRDLAPVDAFISARTAQWIMGDEVQLVASREYFEQVLSVNNAVGRVKRSDTVRDEETTVTLTYLGSPGSVTVTTSPRVMIGTGLTINARRRLVLHLVKTHDANVPVRLSVTATGDAVRGRKQEVLQRGPMLGLGGELRRSGSGFAWVPQS